MNYALPLLATVKFPHDIALCLDAFKDHLALVLQIIRSSGIETLIKRIPSLLPYFLLPENDDEVEKRRQEISRLIIFGLICELDINNLGKTYSIISTENNLVTLKSLSEQY